MVIFPIKFGDGVFSVIDISNAAPRRISRSLRTKITKTDRGTIWFNQRAVIQPIIRSLSATGSKIFPKSVCHLKNLARKPSIASEIDAMANKINAKIYFPARRLRTIGMTKDLLTKEIRLGINLK